MPNTEVKPFSADGTWLETTWESRTLPDSMKKKDLPVRVGLSFHITRKSYFQIIPTNVQHCTWLGFFLPPAVRDFRQEKSHGRVGGRTRKKRFSFRLQRPYFLVIFDQVRERTWLDSSLRQKYANTPDTWYNTNHDSGVILCIRSRIETSRKISAL